MKGRVKEAREPAPQDMPEDAVKEAKLDHVTRFRRHDGATPTSNINPSYPAPGSAIDFAARTGEFYRSDGRAVIAVALQSFLCVYHPRPRVAP